ncbi:MAG: polysaccharide pyruvyl transferase family protein [Deltaproteobacteria bacterium]|nr:polysaccharide pyruvyl transferase family protein [Deltaproteobacteria bacterium]
MQLIYHEGNNFGDELSPYIFKHLLPGYFDTNDEVYFYGIGSIIGEHNFHGIKKRIIFSSGFGNYMGKPAKLDDNCDVFCVRGPITARLLNIEKDKAITDGAVLLKAFDYPEVEKKYPWSYIPHWSSEEIFSWKSLCDEVGINYISPTADFQFVIEEIRKSNVVISEAMHGVIVSDIFRVPWIPVRTFSKKFDIKWHDWAQSLEIQYSPNLLPRQFGDTPVFVDKIQQRTGIPRILLTPAVKTIAKIQNSTIRRFARHQLGSLKHARQYLSSDAVLTSRYEQLLEKLDLFKKKYPLQQ